MEKKRAVVFGASGSIGTAVAREFTEEGARVFLAGRTKSELDAVANEILGADGYAEASMVDASHDTAVGEYLSRGAGWKDRLSLSS